MALGQQTSDRYAGQDQEEGDEDDIDDLVMMMKMTRVAWFKVK